MGEARSDKGAAERRRPQRFPLLVGLRAFRLIAVWPAWAMLAIAASQVAWLVAPDLPWGKPLRMIGFTGLALGLGAAILPWVMLPALWKGASSLRRAIAVRACDVVIGPEGLRVEGGPAHGFTATWKSLAPPEGMRRANGALVLRGDGGRWLELPLPPDEDERASIEALEATIGARASAGLAPAPRRDPAGILRCPGCGAALPPADAAELACRHCATRVAMPADLVAKVRAAASVSASKRGEERLVALVKANREKPCAEIVAAVRKDVQRFEGKGNQHDDITVMAIRLGVLPEGGAG